MTDANTFVAFSGGKDSTALALLMPDATPVFTDTGWEFDEVYHHIENFERVTGREVIRIQNDTHSLPSYIEHSRFMPGHAARYCTRMFKIAPYNDFLNAHLPATLCIGLRADENRIGNTTEMDGLHIRYPLQEWGYTITDVIRVCLEHDLLPHYPPYMARGGCKGCFYKRYSEIVAMIHLLPSSEMDELQALEESVQDERGQFAFMFPNAGKSIRQIRLEVAMQPTLLKLEDVYAAASRTEDKGAACGLFCHR
jgi:hypothetical protein